MRGRRWGGWDGGCPDWPVAGDNHPGGSCSPTLASSTFSRSVSSDTLLQLRQPAGREEAGARAKGPRLPLRTLQSLGGGMEESVRYLMTPTHEGALGLGRAIGSQWVQGDLTLWVPFGIGASRVACFSGSRTRDPTPGSLCVQNDPFPRSQEMAMGRGPWMRLRTSPATPASLMG